MTRWKIFALIASSAIFLIFYVNNVISINNQLKSIYSLNKELKQIRNYNHNLRIKLNFLQSPERIIPIAEEKLGMIKSEVVPELISE